MLSRVANSIYWLNRYIGRAENIARFSDVNFNMSLDMPMGMVQQWEPLIMTSGDRISDNNSNSRISQIRSDPIFIDCKIFAKSVRI